MNRRSSTIRDVARLAGVSVTTVSYVFNEKPGISLETRQRVRQAAADLHYSPNALIRSIQTRRTHLIGIYLWPLDGDPTAHITSDLLRGVTSELADTQYDLLIYSHRPGRFDQANVSPFLDKRVDGLIWTPRPQANGALELLQAAGLPTVALLHGSVPPGMGHVGVDNRPGACAVVRHLVQLGHRHIAFAGCTGTADLTERWDGYREALSEAGLAPAAEIAPPDGWPATTEVLEQVQSSRATALFCATDALALKVRDQALRSGLRVPEDLSLAGFDDVPAARHIPGGLTTATIQAEQLGREAVRLTLDLIRGSAAPEARRVFPTQLQTRGSTAPPA